jgi:hypothetical protein
MSIADLVYEQVKALPDQLAREVLDFVGYIRARSSEHERLITEAQEHSRKLRDDPKEQKILDELENIQAENAVD